MRSDSHSYIGARTGEASEFPAARKRSTITKCRAQFVKRAEDWHVTEVAAAVGSRKNDFI